MKRIKFEPGLPPPAWLLAVYLVGLDMTACPPRSRSANWASEVPTAWLMQRWLAQVRAERDVRYWVHGQVQVDDDHIGGEVAGQSVPLIPQLGELF